MATPFPVEIRERMLQLKFEGKTNPESGKVVGLSSKQVTWFFSYYARSEKRKAENRPKLKRGRKPNPEPTRKELEKIIKTQQKLIKLYEDFLHLSGRM